MSYHCLSHWYVNEGAIVKKAQLLFQLRNPQYEEAVRSAKAAVKIAQDNVKSSQIMVNQIVSGYTQQAISPPN
ncbi:MAG: biotin/lipoyl-binding protein [Gelidibacter sp.]